MIARFIQRFALLVIGAWALAVVIGNSVAPQLEQLITLEDQPYSPYGTATWEAVQWSARAFDEAPGDNIAYVVIEKDSALDDSDRLYYDQLLAALRSDSRHIFEVEDRWGIPATADAAVSADHKAVFATLRLSGMIGTSQAREAITAVRSIVAQMSSPDGVHVFVTGPGVTILDEFAAIDRHTQLITLATFAVLLVLLLILYRSLITAMVPLVTVVMSLAIAKPIITLLVDREVIGVNLFSLELSTAVVVGTGTVFAIFLIGRYHERRRQDFDPADALDDAYRGVAPAIVASTLIVVAPLGAVGWLDLARISMFGTTGILCSIGVIAVGLAALTLTPALIALASRFDLLKPPERRRTLRRFRRIGTAVARWPAPYLLGSGVLAVVLLIALPGVPIGWNEAAATPRWAPSNLGYQAADRHFPPNELLPAVVTIETDHDIRNPTGLTAVEKITTSIMAIPGVRMVQSASHPSGLASKQAALTASGGNLGDNLYDFGDLLAARQDALPNLETAANEVVKSLDLLQGAMQQSVYGIGQVSLAVHLTQDAIVKLRSRSADVVEIFDPLRSFVGSIPDCVATPVCAAAQGAVAWANGVSDTAKNLADGAEQLAQGIADAAATSGGASFAQIMDQVSGQMAQVRASAAQLKLVLNNPATPVSILEMPGYLHELAAVSPDAPGANLYASRRILTDPNMRPVLDDFISSTGLATRLLVYGEGDEWGSEGAERARAIVSAVKDATQDGTLKPVAVQLTGVGPTTRDIQDLVGGDLLLLVAITLVVIFAIAALLLRSPLAGIVVLATIAMSYVCALGASVMFWQRLLGYELHWLVPPIAFVLLIALGSSGNLLLARRMREERPGGPRVSIIRTFAATGAVITVAGIVIGITMFGLATSSALSVAQIGVTVGLGLLLDALVVRSFVLPAIVVVLERWIWWPREPV
ncbi:MMPL/RND family transporter [Mycobacterium bourgelatii]|uniref:Transporter n=1 Tax=Mycobacterium bourgelatii TaxID=1273442 RepID=A0A7I9YPK7_MYCBU|nr:RND family transporter [Mycobacterium bourgelatii]MCV6973774.1 RND family transporter [Mycobacterium bourgelatii]GFG90614.1 transporter [Mycobacterium bourgelatii]